MALKLGRLGQRSKAHRRLYLAHVWLGAVVLCAAVRSGAFSVIVLLMATFLSFAYLDEHGPAFGADED